MLTDYLFLNRLKYFTFVVLKFFVQKNLFTIYDYNVDSH